MKGEKQQYIERLESMSNQGLIDELEGLVGGDYDLGCFTDWGIFKLDQLKIEILKRMNK